MATNRRRGGRCLVVLKIDATWPIPSCYGFQKSCRNDDPLFDVCSFYKRRSYCVGLTKAEFSIPMDGDECGVFKIATTSKLVEILMYIQSIIDR